MAVQWKKLTKEIEDTILSEKLLNPEASLRDIAKEANVSHQTVDNVLDKAPELLTSIDTWRTDKLLSTLDTIISEWNEVIRMFVWAIRNDPDNAIPVKTYNDLTAISWLQEKAWKQKQIIKWDVTERIAIEDLSSLSPKELEAERNKLL